MRDGFFIKKSQSRSKYTQNYLMVYYVCSSIIILILLLISFNVLLVGRLCVRLNFSVHRRAAPGLFNSRVYTCTYIGMHLNEITHNVIRTFFDFDHTTFSFDLYNNPSRTIVPIAQSSGWQ